MATVILGRRRGVAGAAASVHAWHVPDVDVGVLSSPCGLHADPSELERVERFSGAPCEACWLLAIAQAPAPEESPSDQVIVSDEHAGGLYRYGVALRGDAEVHLVESSAISAQLDGRTVVQTLCRFLAWGPLSGKPQEWPVCDECCEVAAR